MKFTKVLFILTAVILSLSLCSCGSKDKKKKAPLSAAITNENYSFGSYKAEFNATMFNLDKAVRRACARARFTKTYHVYRTNACEYKFIDVDKVPVEISLNTLEEDSGTGIKIRIGSWGDKDSSEQLLLAIDEELRLLLQLPPTDAK